MSAVPAADGNPEELEALLPDIVQAVRAACWHYGVDQSQIQDFYHEIILLLIEDDYRRLRSFRGDSSRETWLTAIARHYVGGHVARQKKATSLDEIPVDRVVCNPTQEDELIAEEQAGELVEAVSLLTGRDQQLFALLRRDDLNLGGHRNGDGNQN